MKKATLLMIGALLATASAFGVDNISPSMLGCEDAKAIVAAGGKLELGKWYTDWATVKKYSEDNGLPVLFIWSNHGCIHCSWTDKCFLQDDFKTWAANNDAGKVLYCFMAGGESGYPDQQGSAAYTWMWKQPSSIDAFPFVTLYWPGHGKNGIVLHKTGDQFNSNKDGKKPDKFWTEKSLPERVANVIYWMETTFKDWHPTPAVVYDGGIFTQTNYPHASLQAEKSTASVNVEMVRDSLLAASQKMRISVEGANAGPETVTIDWAKGQTAQTYTVKGFGTKWFAAGRNVVLELMGKDADGNDKVMSTVKIACVDAKNSAQNPDFSGCSDFGVWTMDLEAAQAKVQKQGGKAYTLVCVQGSQWCPDCGNVERNFLNLTDGSGANRFAAWAKLRNVALVTVDIPNYNSASADAASPCLLTKDAYETAPDGEKALRSGLGYLTRKMVSDEKAAEVLARNHTLVGTMTAEGGLNRPEERDYKNRLYRTGAPIFAVLDKNGKVRAELVRLAEDSPTDASNFDNFLKRFDEMLDIADSNATEIENNYASAGSVSFAANGGSESARLCNADMYDTFRLSGIGGNALQRVVVKGDAEKGFDADCEVTVEFQKLDADGRAVTLGEPKTGKLSEGVALDYTFTAAGDYYVQVRGWGSDRKAGYDSPAFSLKSAKEAHFQNYVITGSAVLVPQEDRATARPPAGSDKVSIVLKAKDESGEPVVYYIVGMKEEGGCEKLVPVPGAAKGVYAATEDGVAEITLDRVDGELTYQIWKSGEVGFDGTEMEVEKSACDEAGEPIEIRVCRTGGKSGSVTVRVTLDETCKLYQQGRIWLTNGTDRAVAELTWEDGDAEDKFVQVWIEDDIGEWDPDYFVGLTAEIVESEAGDVVISEGKGAFTLLVAEEIGGDPGEAHLTGTEPAPVNGKVYVRAGEGMVFAAERTGGSSGLLEVLLVSSVKGATYETENPRDLGKFAEEHPELAARYPEYADATLLWWSSHEGGEKSVKVGGIPAGKTATISFIPLNGDKSGFKGAESFTVVSLADDAPAFEKSELSTACFRYVEGAGKVGITGLQGGEVSFKCLSGSLPKGLSAVFDKESGSLELSGAVAEKSGVFKSLWQVFETREGVKVEGSVMSVALTVRDFTKPDPLDPEAAYNPAVAKSRTIKDIPVYSEEGKRLVGTVQVTIPTSGKVSAKFSGFDGKVSLSAKNWTLFNVANGSLQADLVSKDGKSTMVVEAQADGQVGILLQRGEKDSFTALSDGKAWSKVDSAADWVGYYTVALRQKAVISQKPEGCVPAGYGYLTLKMNASAAKSGKMTVAGLLPNGAKVSGSYVLVREIAGQGEDGVAYLPIVKAASKDSVSAVVGIVANAQENRIYRAVESPSWCGGYWRHEEKNASYEVGFTLHGSYYDDKEDLGACCADFYGKTDLCLSAAGACLVGIKVGTDTIKVDGANPSGVKLSFKRSTGVVTGSFKDDELGTLKYFGIVVNGWGDGCGCGNYDVYLPFMSGAFTSTQKSPKMVLGDEVKIDK